MEHWTTHVHTQPLGGALTAMETAAAELLAMITTHDRATATHLDRVGALATRIGQALTLPEAELALLRWAGRLHDIGKLTISPRVLRAAEPLSPLEAHRMARQPLVGALLVKPLPAGPVLAPIVRWHCERLDGSGNPDGLIGTEIPLAARIVAVADAFDAMTSPRPYRVMLCPTTAIARLRADTGRLWDAEVIAALAANLGLRAGSGARPASGLAA